MVDVVSPSRRARMMAGIRDRNTKPELLVRSALHRQGLRFRIQCRDLPGRPDLVLPKHAAAVQVHGCYWHRHEGCRLAYTPKTRTDFWETKFAGNVVRDARTNAALQALGWRVAIVWECGLRDRTQVRNLLQDLGEWIRNGAEGPVEFPYQAVVPKPPAGTRP